MMIADTPAYLTSKEVMEDSWIKAVKSAESPEKLADLIVARILKPASNGPPLLLDTIDSGYDILEIDVIRDLVSYVEIEWDTFNRAVEVIMDRIISDQIKPNLLFLENVFVLIEQFAVEEASSSLFSWLVSHKNMLDSNQSERRVYLIALDAYVYSQKEDDEASISFWKEIWYGLDPLLWGVAFKGLRYSDVETTLSEMKTLFDRNCEDLGQYVASLWRIEPSQNSTKVDNWIRDAIRFKNNWAFEMINDSIRHLKSKDKFDLINRISILGKNSNVESNSY